MAKFCITAGCPTNTLPDSADRCHICGSKLVTSRPYKARPDIPFIVYLGVIVLLAPILGHLIAKATGQEPGVVIAYIVSAVLLFFLVLGTIAIFRHQRRRHPSYSPAPFPYGFNDSADPGGDVLGGEGGVDIGGGGCGGGCGGGGCGGGCGGGGCGGGG